MSDDRTWSDDNRPSWREIDKRRGESKHRREDKTDFAGTIKQQERVRAQAKRAANEIFKPKKDPAQDEAEKALEAAKGTPAFDDEALKFMESYGVTTDWRVQLLLCEAGQAAVAVPAIEALAAGAGTYGDAEMRNVVIKLKMLAMTGKMKIKKAAKQALEILE